jgi:cystathionine beta-lyase/cystathionine gamma-synthase
MIFNSEKDIIIKQSIYDLKDDFTELSAIIYSYQNRIVNFKKNISKVKKHLYQKSYDSILDQLRSIENCLKDCQSEIVTIQKDIGRGSTQENLFKLIEKKHLLFDFLRTQVNILSAIITALDFQSPAFSASNDYSMAGQFTGKILATINDYKRDGRLDNRELENWYKKEFIDLNFKFRINCYATNSGMAAFTTILNFLFLERKINKTILIGESCYHENKKLLEKLPFEIIKVNESDTQLIIEKIRKHNPEGLFFDSLTNTQNIFILDWQKILRFLVGWAQKDIYFVLDNTCLSSTIQPFREIVGKSKKVHLIVFESLLKYLQMGMDRANAGMISTYGKDTHLLMEYREHLGTNISDSSVYAIPWIKREIYEKRLYRFQRNAFFLAQELNKYIKQTNHKKIKEIIYPRSNYLPTVWQSDKPTTEKQISENQSFHGSFFTFRFYNESISVYKKFLKIVINEARKEKVQIYGGTSFGFNTSRIYLTALQIKVTKPFVRFSAGTETIWEIEKIKNALIKAMNAL